MNTLLGSEKYQRYIWIWMITLIFIAVFLKNAWISEDAFINFRSVEQVWEGNGPRWNPHERVQVYTSVAWFWLITLIYPIFKDPFLQILLMSATAMAIYIFVLDRLVRNPLIFFVCVLLLICSRGFMDYTTSGLENPLCYAWFAIWGYQFLNCDSIPYRNRYPYIIFGIFSGTVVLCRHDLFLMILPVIMYYLYTSVTHKQKIKGFRFATAIILPGMLWTLFSVIYYGFPFPNTAYAKLNTGIPRIDLVMQGFMYFIEIIKRDIMTVIGISAAILLSIKYGNFKHIIMSMGVLFYLAYLLCIGGDFMLSRMAGIGFSLSVLVIADIMAKNRVNRFFLFFVIIALGSFAIVYPVTPLKTGFNYENKFIRNGIVDERGFYFKQSSFFKYMNREGTSYFPVHKGSKAGFLFRSNNQPIMATKHIGYFGFWSGTQKIIVDPLGLSDPLLARLPVSKHLKWRIGHFERDIPEGYIPSILKNKNLIMHPSLQARYNLIKMVTQSDKLFTKKRWKAIWRLNMTGINDNVGRNRS